jgi:hypothetical protein
MNRLAMLACAALAALPAAGLAQDTVLLVGTWECRIPGSAPTNTPPIVWFGGAYSGGNIVPGTVDVDGFARQVYGLSNVTTADGGWIRIQPQEGQPFLVKPLSPPGQNSPAMSLKRGDASYDCRRLPLTS